MNREQNLLFGLLATHLSKVEHADYVKAAAACGDDSERDLGEHLLAEGIITKADRVVIQSMVNVAVRVFKGDAKAALDALGGEERLATPPWGGPDSTDGETVAYDSGFDEAGISGEDGTFGDEGTFGSDATAISAELSPGAVDDEMPAVQEHRGRYEEIREYAAGGMGRILLVLDKHFGRNIALKELLADHVYATAGATRTRTGAPTSDILTIPACARFVQEAKITAQLEHPAIVPVYELGYRDDGSLYYTMKMVRGKTLHDAMVEAESLAGRLELLTHFLDLCQAISYAHSCGVIHRDIKPKNVLVGEFGETVVIDWGIAKVKGRSDIHARDLEKTYVALHEDTVSTVKTMYGHALGSPYYMPPEQAEGKIEKIDERSDVYALGAVLYTLITGKLPYLGYDVRTFLKKVLEEPPKPIREVEKDAPPELIAICERAMKLDPADRYANAKELTEEVRRFISGGLVQAYDYRYRELFRRFYRRHKDFILAGGTSLLVLIGVCYYAYLQIGSEKNAAIEARDAEALARVEEMAAKDRAVEAQKKEVKARKAAERDLYSANTQLTQRSLDERRLKPARDFLAGCPEDNRQWEWGRLMFEANADLMTLKAGGQFAAFTPSGEGLLGTVWGTVTLHDWKSGETIHTYVEEGGFGSVVAMSADGARLAVNGDDAVRVWDVSSRKQLFAFEDVVPSEGNWTHCMAFSADGGLVAARVDAETLAVWDVASGQERFRFPVERRNRGLYVDFSPDGQVLAAGMTVPEIGLDGIIWENKLTLYDTGSGESRASHAFSAEGYGYLHALTFAPGGDRLATGTDSRVTVYNVPSWTKRAEFDAPISSPGSVVFSPDGARVAAGGKDGVLSMWNLEEGKLQFSEKAHQDFVHELAFSPDGARVATASYDRTAKLWDAATGRELDHFRGHTGQVFCVAFNARGTRLATGDYDGSTKLWAADADLRHIQANAIDFCWDRGFLAGSDDNVLKLWDSHTGRVVRTFEGHGKNTDGETSTIFHVAFDAEGARLASIARETFEGDDAYVLRTWDVDSGGSLQVLNTGLRAADEIVFGADDRYLAVRGSSELKLWKKGDPDPAHTFSDIDGFEFSPSGALLAMGSQEGHITVLELDSGEFVGKFETVAKWGMCFIFSADESRLFAYNQHPTSPDEPEGGVNVWPVSDPESVTTFRAHDQRVTCIAQNPDGTILATGSGDKKVKLWNAETYEELHELEGHADFIVGLQFSPDGQRLATASADGTFRLWDCATGNELITLQDAAQRVKGTFIMPERLTFSPDGQQLIVITEPQALQPIVLNVFPWELAAYPGDADETFQDRVEAYKRGYWKDVIEAM